MGTERDIVQSYLWFNMAAERGHEEAQVNRDRVVDMMTPDQIIEAERIAGVGLARNPQRQ